MKISYGITVHNEADELNKFDLDELFFEFCQYVKHKNRWFEVLKKIDSPSSNLLNMRFVSCDEKRNKLIYLAIS